MFPLKVAVILLVSVIVISEAKPHKDCKKHWDDKSKWRSCLWKTNTNTNDIRPYKEKLKKLRNHEACLRLCFEKEHCPPTSKGKVKKFNKNLKKFQCTFESIDIVRPPPFNPFGSMQNLPETINKGPAPIPLTPQQSIAEADDSSESGEPAKQAEPVPVQPNTEPGKIPAAN